MPLRLAKRLNPPLCDLLPFLTIMQAYACRRAQYQREQIINNKWLTGNIIK
jgi:hypothetical protein